MSTKNMTVHELKVKVHAVSDSRLGSGVDVMLARAIQHEGDELSSDGVVAFKIWKQKWADWMRIGTVLTLKVEVESE